MGDESGDNAVYVTDIQREGGYIPIPHCAGLGVDLDEKLLARATYSPMNIAKTLLRADGSVANSV